MEEDVRETVQKGDRVHAFAGGQFRVLRVEAVTSNAQLAQCSWTERNTKHYVTCLVAGVRKVGEAAASERPGSA